MLISNTIDDALVMIGVKNPIDEASPQDHEYGLRTLNRIIDSYNTQNLLITYLEDIAYEMPTVNSECETADPDELIERKWKSSIEIGYCKDLNSQAPVNIQGLFWRQDGTDYFSKAMASNQWSGIAFKQTQGIPRSHYIQRADDNSLKLYFDLIPQDNLELHLMAKMPYTGKNCSGNEYLPTDDINWGYGFEKMLMYRLAVELCPSYSISASDDLKAVAGKAESDVKSFNYSPMVLKSDVTLRANGRRGNISRLNRARF